MRTYICDSCQSSIIVGVPRHFLRRRALALAKESYSLFQRWFRRRKTVGKLLLALEEKYYLQPNHYRVLPSACPRCGFRSQGDEPWWRPGLSDQITTS